MIDEGTPQDLIVDLTSRGCSSDVIQSLTASLGIPTVTASSAAEDDLKYDCLPSSLSYPIFTGEWSGLSSSQEKYLLQVRPPGDILPEVIRNLVQNTRISSVAVLYDETFGKRLFKFGSSSRSRSIILQKHFLFLRILLIEVQCKTR